jgi:hypothetical protein
MLTKNPPESQRKLADQELLRALLHRSNYASADLRARSDRDYAREVVVIERLRKGMVMSDMQAAVWENVAFSHAAALRAEVRRVAIRPLRPRSEASDGAFGQGDCAGRHSQETDRFGDMPTERLRDQDRGWEAAGLQYPSFHSAARCSAEAGLINTEVASRSDLYTATK